MRPLDEGRIHRQPPVSRCVLAQLGEGLGQRGQDAGVMRGREHDDRQVQTLFAQGRCGVHDRPGIALRPAARG